MKTRLLLLVALVLVAFAPRGFSQAVLRPGDSFEMQLNGMPVEYSQDFRGMYTIGDEGMVSIPLIGPMRAAGISVAQFARSIEKKLVTDKIFTTPTVLLNLQPQSRFVTVGGAVRNPSAVPWSPDLTLSAAIKRASGTSDFANDKKVRVTREGKVAVFNLRLAGQDPNQNPKLLPGDEVEVPE